MAGEDEGRPKGVWGTIDGAYADYDGPESIHSRPEPEFTHRWMEADPPIEMVNIDGVYEIAPDASRRDKSAEEIEVDVRDFLRRLAEFAGKQEERTLYYRDEFLRPPPVTIMETMDRTIFTRFHVAPPERPWKSGPNRRAFKRNSRRK